MATKQTTNGRKELGWSLARFTWRRVFIRVVALAGCLAAIVGVYVSVRAYRQIERAQTVAQAQLRETSATFRQVAASLRTVSDWADHAATTVDGARGRSARPRQRRAMPPARSMIRPGRSTLRSRSRTRSRWMASDTNFRNTATQLRTLADTIDQTGGSLEQNATDLRAISRDVDAMATQMDRVSDQLRQFAGDGPGESGLLQIAGGARLILSWSVVIHLLLFAMSVSLFLLTTDGLDGRQYRDIKEYKRSGDEDA